MRLPKSQRTESTYTAVMWSDADKAFVYTETRKHFCTRKAVEQCRDLCASIAAAEATRDGAALASAASDDTAALTAALTAVP